MMQREASKRADKEYQDTCTFQPAIPTTKSGRCGMHRTPHGFDSYVHRIRNAAVIAEDADRHRAEVVFRQSQMKQVCGLRDRLPEGKNTNEEPIRQRRRFVAAISRSS